MAPPTWIVSLVKEATQVKWLQVGLISFLVFWAEIGAVIPAPFFPAFQNYHTNITPNPGVIAKVSYETDECLSPYGHSFHNGQSRSFGSDFRENVSGPLSTSVVVEFCDRLIMTAVDEPTGLGSLDASLGELSIRFPSQVRTNISFRNNHRLSFVDTRKEAFDNDFADQFVFSNLD
jgi:hypothetical protein